MFLESLELEISNPCNEHCVHCYRLCDKTKKGFLSAKDVENILDQVSSFRSEILNTTITGGESLLNNEWREILNVIQRKKCRFSLFTNGSLLTQDDADFLTQFIDKGLKEVQLSLYALEPEIHDSITGLKGSCEKTKKAIEMLHARNIPVFVSCPAMQQNKNVLPNVMRWADKNGIGSCADLMIFGSSDYSGKNLSQRLSFEDLDSFFDKTMEDDGALSYVWGRDRGKPNLSNILFYGGAARNLCISGDGSIYPMIGWYECLGNIYENNLKEIFFSAPPLQKCRKIKVADFVECTDCNAIGYCSLCPIPHLNANKGELMKLDKQHCNYIHKVKELAGKRNYLLERKSEMKAKVKEELYQFLKTEGGLVINNQIVLWFTQKKSKCNYSFSLEEILKELSSEKKIICDEKGAKAL